MEIQMSPNKLVQFLGKPPNEFTKRDIVRFIEAKDIRMVNFRYVGGDGRLKQLNFVINNKAQLDSLLSVGERVDGSSLFPYIDAASSDLYVIPRFKTAYVNPFSNIPALDILCSYYTNEGEPLPSSPESVLRKAHQALKEKTGMSLQAMGELEYYVFSDKQEVYPPDPQKGYHESSPFSKWELLRREAMETIAQSGGTIKYGHTEVGFISGEYQDMEQHEIEFTPVPLEDAADEIVIAKYILRMTGYKHNVPISFAPKVVVGHAGSGLHIHSKLMKGKQNMLVDGDRLSDSAKKMIAGYLSMARSLTAFGNTVPLSYLRLVPHQEAPTNICWGDRNRSTLVRVPLGWLGVGDMVKDANPQETDDLETAVDNQTVEFRSPDGSANIYFLLAGLAVAARHGLEMENAIEYADKLYAGVNIFEDEHSGIRDKLPQLPASCWESAECLLDDREVYEADGVFSPVLIDGVVDMLKGYDDMDLSERLYGKDEEIEKLVEEYLHCS
jgi:glutamine synthetase